MEYINIIIKDTDGSYGFALVYDIGQLYSTIMYQNRLNLDITDDYEMIDELADGKAYYHDAITMLECINAVLNFWFIDPLKELPDIKTYSNIRDAIKRNPDENIIIYKERNLKEY